MAKISTYPISSSTDGANLLGSDSSGATSQFAYPSSSSTTMLSQEIRNMLLEESRPISLVKAKASSGDPVSLSDTVAGGDIVIDPGRAVYIESILVSTDIAGMIYGSFSRSNAGTWIGASLEDSFQVATIGGAVSIPVGAIYGEFFRFSMTFRASRNAQIDETGEYLDPNMAIKIMGIEFTNDLNFKAKKRLVYTGDSISWSLMGDWRPHDQTQNLSYSSADFPENFGDQLASFRLINALRESKGEDIRLVNKGFGGSKMIQEQWYALRNGLYSLDWNMFVMQAGVNDARVAQTPLRQLTFIERAKDHVRYRDKRGRSNYPIVFCTTPSLDDRGDGTGSRNNLDSRVVLTGNSEAYDNTFDSGSDAAINLSADVTDNRLFKVQGDNSLGGMYVSGGEVGEIYRVDFFEETTIETGDQGSNANSFTRLLENISVGTLSGVGTNGLVTIPANTTLYLLCVSQNEEYHEIERTSLLGRELSGSTFDPINSHYIAKNFTSATTIEGPVLGSVRESAAATSLVSRGGTTVTLAVDAGITTTGLPDSAYIDTNDVWCRVYDFVDTNQAEISWNEFNGFYRVVGYTASGDNITEITVAFDSRNAGASGSPPYYRDFRGNRISSYGTIEILKLRDVVVEFEGTASSTESNCARFVNGTASIDGGNYSCVTQLKSGSTFNLTSGKGIAFSLYQQGNVIYMNEVSSGDITNAGYLLGSDSYDNFYSQSEIGASRAEIVNNMITTVVDDYGSDNCVYLVDLNDSSDIIGVTKTSAGRLKYGSTTAALLNPEGTAVRYKVSDLIEDPVFKRVGDTGNSECIVGERLHRSPKGHELLFNRLWAKIQTITIPS